MNKRYYQQIIESLTKKILKDKNGIAQDLERTLKNKNDICGFSYSTDEIIIEIRIKKKKD